MYKLVAIDCDGALLTDSKELTKRTINTIKKASQKVKIVLATARSFYRVEEYLEKMNLLNDEQYTICFNGGSVINNGRKEELDSHTFRNDEIKQLIQLSRKFNTQIMLYAYNCLIVEEIPEKFINNKKINFEITKMEKLDLEEQKIYKIVFINKPSKITDMRKKLSKQILDSFEVSSSIPDYIEFVPKGITKNKALENLCKKLNICKNEVIAIGDAENDIQMLKFAGMGIAMGNADEKTKSISDYITDSNNNDGVAKALEKFLKF